MDEAARAEFRAYVPARSGAALAQGQPLAARGVPELRGGPAVPVAYDVVVVTAG